MRINPISYNYSNKQFSTKRKVSEPVEAPVAFQGKFFRSKTLQNLAVTGLIAGVFVPGAGVGMAIGAYIADKLYDYDADHKDNNNDKKDNK